MVYKLIPLKQQVVSSICCFFSMKYRLLFCCVWLIGVAKAQNFCADSSSYFRYSSLAGDRLIVEKTILLKDSSKLTVGSIIGGQSYVRAFISKIDKNGFVAWFKRITAPYGNGGTEIESVAEAANGNIFVATTSAQLDGKPYFLMVLSAKGTILSQQKIGFLNIPFLGNRWVRTPLISQFGSDSMLINFYAKPNASTEGELLTLCTTDNLGQLGQAYTFNAPIVTIRSSYFDNCRINGSSIELFGVTEYWSGCEVNSIERTAFAYIKIDWQAKQVIAKKVFCTPPEGDGFGYFNSQYDEFPGNNGKHNIFLQANGRILFARSYIGLEYNGSDTINRLFSVSEFDENFNHVKSEYITANNQFKRNSYYELYIDSQNQRHVRIHDQPTNRLLYAIGKASGFFVQKSISFSRDMRSGKMTRQNFIEPGYLTSFNIISADSQYGYLDNFRILAKDTAQGCFGNNTDFLSYKPASLFSINWTGNFTVQKAIIETTYTVFSLQDYPLQKETICNIVRRCDTLKINAPKVVCNLSQPVKITAHKNQLCPGPVQFVFDTTNVTSYNQINDTTLLLNFNKAWNGKIYAYTTACSLLKDSVTLAVVPIVQNFDLGGDIQFCKGKTYTLKAPGDLQSYTWQDGSSESVYVVRNPGKYFVTVQDACGRLYSDTVVVSDNDFLVYAGKDTSICRSERLTLSATDGYSNYSWSPSYNLSSTTGKTISVFPVVNTAYSVSVEVFPNCFINDTVIVSVKDCPQYFFMPTAFTPNKDGRNEVLKPIISGVLEFYEFSVYNRWGERVFFTKDKYQGWNGTTKGKEQNSSVFVWYCSYKFIDRGIQTRKGTVLLIK